MSPNAGPVPAVDREVKSESWLLHAASKPNRRKPKIQFRKA
jgi:hypothetical protein